MGLKDFLLGGLLVVTASVFLPRCNYSEAVEGIQDSITRFPVAYESSAKKRKDLVFDGMVDGHLLIYRENIDGKNGNNSLAVKINNAEYHLSDFDGVGIDFAKEKVPVFESDKLEKIRASHPRRITFYSNDAAVDSESGRLAGKVFDEWNDFYNKARSLIRQVLRGEERARLDSAYKTLTELDEG